MAQRTCVSCKYWNFNGGERGDEDDNFYSGCQKGKWEVSEDYTNASELRDWLFEATRCKEFKHWQKRDKGE